MSGDCVFTMNGGTIAGGTASVGGNVNTNYNAVFTLNDGVVEGGTATGSGGGNFRISTPSKVVMTGGVVRNGLAENNPTKNTSSSGEPTYVDYKVGCGGNFYIGADSNKKGVLEISGGQIYDGIANGNHGGNILSNGTVTMSGGMIWGGVADADRQVTNHGYDVNGCSVQIYGNFTMTAGSIGINAEGKAAGGITFTPGGEGGNLAVGSNANVRLSGGKIAYGNVLEDESGTKTYGKIAKGGNLYVIGTCEITGTCEVYGGYATDDGGNITLYSNPKLTISGGKIWGGSANRGGNIVFGGNTTYTDTYTLRITGGEIWGGEARTGAGGNIYCYRAENDLYISGDAEVYGGTAKTYGNNIFNAGELYLSGQVKLNEVYLGKDTGKTGEIGKIVDNGIQAGSEIYLYANYEVKPAVTSTNAATVANYLEVVHKEMQIETQGDEINLVYKPHENHCECGYDTSVVLNGHTHAAVTDWKPLPEDLTDFEKLPSGNYYLVSDINITTCSTFFGEHNIKLCLNGYNITTSTESVFGNVHAGTNITICDCSYENGQWGGTISGNDTGKARAYGGVINLRADATMIVYGGNFVGAMGGRASAGGIFNVCNDGMRHAMSEADKTAVLEAYLNKYNTEYPNAQITMDEMIAGKHDTQAFLDYMYSAERKTSLTIYNGSFTGGYLQFESENTNDAITAFGGAIINTWHKVTVNIYGGTYYGGRAEEGGCFYLSGGCDVHMENCTISGGTANSRGGVMWINFGTISANGNIVIDTGTINVIGEAAYPAAYLLLNGNQLVSIHTTEQRAINARGANTEWVIVRWGEGDKVKSNEDDTTQDDTTEDGTDNSTQDDNQGETTDPQ